jgi:hypothetical protein
MVESLRLSGPKHPPHLLPPRQLRHLHRHLPVANPVSDPNDARISRCLKGVWPDHPNRRDWAEPGIWSLNGFSL